MEELLFIKQIIINIIYGNMKYVLFRVPGSKTIRNSMVTWYPSLVK
jgi:hypothetical protein